LVWSAPSIQGFKKIGTTGPKEGPIGSFGLKGQHFGQLFFLEQYHHVEGPKECEKHLTLKYDDIFLYIWRFSQM
jgi:hypothetical protein